MFGIRRFGWTSAALLAAIFLAPQPTSVAAEPSRVSYDLQTQSGEVLGQYLTAEGAPVAAAKFSLSQNGRVLATIQTDAQGAFRFEGVSPGAYVIASRDFAVVCRVWNRRAAPPSARPSILFVAQDREHIVRGQAPFQPILRAYTPVWYAVVGAAIVVPVLVYRANQDAKPAS